MEIERKFLVKKLPSDLGSYPCRQIEQAYLCTEPVVRIRQDNDDYYLTYKGQGLMVREEYNLPLTQSGYEHLLLKADGNIITKKRYVIPYNAYSIELDIFEGVFCGMVLAEVEFPTKEEALAFLPPDWFAEDVTANPAYQNSSLSKKSM
jgi:CYTH domain-containing protein